MRKISRRQEEEENQALEEFLSGFSFNEFEDNIIEASFEEENDTFDEWAKVSPIFLTGDNIHVQDAIFVGSRKNLTDNDEVKKAIMNCGSLAIEYYSSIDDSEYNNKQYH